MQKKAIQTIAEEFLQTKNWGGLRLYSCELRESGREFHIEIELDDLTDPHGAVSIGKCAEFSRAFVLFLDRSIESKTKGLPTALTTENYSLGVSSAGVNRQIRVPEDLERFRELPLEIKYSIEQDANGKGAIKKELCKYQGQEGESGNYQFKSYQKKIKKKGKEKKAPPRTFALPREAIREVRLFLDV